MLAGRWYLLVVLLLLALLLALQGKLWVSDSGLRGMHLLQQEIDAQQMRNERLQNRNDALIAEVDDLKHGEDAIEERARHYFGFIRPDEIFYQVLESEPDIKLDQTDNDKPGE